MRRIAPWRNTILSHYALKEKNRGVGRNKVALHVQKRTDLRMLTWKHVSWESNEDFERLVTQAQLMHDANQLFITHADQPADTPATGCDTFDEPMNAPLSTAPSSSSVTGAAIKRNAQVLGLAHRLWQRAQELNLCLFAPHSRETLNCRDDPSLTRAPKFSWTRHHISNYSPCSCVHWPQPVLMCSLAGTSWRYTYSPWSCVLDWWL